MENNSIQDRLHQITPLSKYLALLLFIILPFLGAWIGYSYTPITIIELEKQVEPEIQALTSSTTAPRIATMARIINDSVEVTFSDQRSKIIAKAIRAEEVEDIYLIESYLKALISPDGKYVAIEGVGFEDSFIRVYRVDQNRLEEKSYGSLTQWSKSGLLMINACDLSGEECVPYISLTAEKPWMLKEVVQN